MLHIVTAVVDPFTHLGLTAALVPFGSYYRTFWLGLGAIAFELMVAIVATQPSAPRHRRARWRAVHSARAPELAGGGAARHRHWTDASTLWMIGVTVVSVGAVLAELAWRWRISHDPPPPRSVASAATA